MSPAPISVVTIQTAPTDWQISFISPHHLPKILGQRGKSITKVALYEPSIKAIAIQNWKFMSHLVNFDTYHKKIEFLVSPVIYNKFLQLKSAT